MKMPVQTVLITFHDCGLASSEEAEIAAIALQNFIAILSIQERTAIIVSFNSTDLTAQARLHNQWHIDMPMCVEQCNYSSKLDALISLRNLERFGKFGRHYRTKVNFLHTGTKVFLRTNGIPVG